MSKLEQLITELCPDGVPYKSLGELGYFYGGLSGKSKDDFTNGNAKLITYMNVYTNLAIDTDISALVRIGKNEKQNTVQYGDILFTGSSETPDECGMSSVFTKETDEKLYLNSFCFGFRLNNENLLIPDFSKYLFRSHNVREQVKRTASGVTRFNVSKKKMEQVIIPLPPLTVQREIVSILDNFTELTEELTEELTAELTARRKQYEYYRDLLLTYGDEVDWIKLGEIADVTKLAGFEFTEHVRYSDSGKIIALRGLNVKNGRLDLSQVKYIDGSNFQKLSRSKLKKGDMLFTYVGTVGQVALIDNNDKYYLAPNVARIRFTAKSINPKFMRYYFQTNNFVSKQINRYMESSSMKNLTMGNIRKFIIPIPSLEEQERIVAILDRFNELYSDLTSSLHAEIEAQQKQYEYYRDKLLTFKEVTV